MHCILLSYETRVHAVLPNNHLIFMAKRTTLILNAKLSVELDVIKNSGMIILYEKGSYIQGEICCLFDLKALVLLFCYT